MLKRKKIHLVCMTLFVLMALFFSTEARAQCDYPECFVINGWTIEIVKGPAGEFPVLQNDGSYRFEYQINPGPSGNRVNQVYLLVPVCTDFSIDVFAASSASFAYFEAGEGDNTIGIGVGDIFQRVMSWPERINPGTESRNIWVDTNTGAATPRSLSLKMGNRLFTGAILGPGCLKVPFETRRLFDGIIAADFDKYTGDLTAVTDAQTNEALTEVVLHVCEEAIHPETGEVQLVNCNKIDRFGPEPGCILYANPTYYGYGGGGYRR